jgi:hypothetical protein
MISIDAAIENGEGYKKTDHDSIFKYSAGLTFKPIKGVTLRGYYDNMGGRNAQETLSGYLGFNFGEFKVGTEYNYQTNHDIEENHDWTGYSFYTSYRIQKFRIFGRYDKLQSKRTDPELPRWNIDKDGQRIIAGFEYMPVKGIKLSPNYQTWLYDTGNPTEHSMYLSCEISF